jgi:hypothetical protein
MIGRAFYCLKNLTVKIFPCGSEARADVASAKACVGASLLAKAPAYPTSPAQADRFREQARSHSLVVVNTSPAPTDNLL